MIEAEAFIFAQIFLPGFWVGELHWRVGTEAMNCPLYNPSPTSVFLIPKDEEWREVTSVSFKSSDLCFQGHLVITDEVFSDRQFSRHWKLMTEVILKYCKYME